jgi:mRNA interferase MazF
MTTGGRPAPFRVAVTFRGKAGLLLCDQIRAIDRARLVRRLGVLDTATLQTLLGILSELFAA